MNKYEKSKKLLPGLPSNFTPRARKPVLERSGLRCPACGENGVVESSVVSGKSSGLISGSRVVDIASGRKIGRAIFKKLLVPLEKRLAREGMPMIWRNYYCTNCGGQFGGDAMFISWFGDYWRRQNSDERDKTINHRF